MGLKIFGVSKIFRQGKKICKRVKKWVMSKKGHQKKI